MSPVPAAGTSAPACELAARLLDYELALHEIARNPFNAARYRLLVEELTAVGHCTIALPQFAADFVDVTVQHFELVRMLCRPRPCAERITPEMAAALLRAQCAKVRAVRERCGLLIAGAPPGRRDSAAQTTPLR